MATRKKIPSRPADKGLRVISRRPSFWRAGRQFGAVPSDVPLSELTEEQEEQIRAEGQPGGQLVVQDIDITPAEDTAETT